MEKSFAPDPAGMQRIIQAGEAAEKKNLKIAAGLMCRHSPARQALIRKIRDGAMGQIQLIRAYRMDAGGGHGPVAKGDESELLWQIRRACCFLWASSGLFIGLMIHQIDECCWIKDAWPVSAHGVGGRVANSPDCGQNLDCYSIEYTFADGTKAMVVGPLHSQLLQRVRHLRPRHEVRRAVLGQHPRPDGADLQGPARSPPTTSTGTTATRNAWSRDTADQSPWQDEWNVLLDAIRNDRPHNEAKRAAYSDLAAIMGRAAVHSGKIITWDEAMASNFQFCPNIDTLNENSPPPVQADAQGRYPAPVPGAWTEI